MSIRALGAVLIAIAVSGCVSLPAAVPRATETAIAPSASTYLGGIAASALGRKPGDAGSGLLQMPNASQSLDARLTLIRRAQSSIDMQYYLLGNDEVGRLILDALHDAAARGVRVRLLVDDFYTLRMDALLLDLASVPNAQVRIFNPFGAGRVSSGGRLLSLAMEFGRLNHRMHNKLFLADGAMAVFGGRNLADEYFLRSVDANFFDFDTLAIGPVVPQLSAIFDTYWNSREVRSIQEVTGAPVPVPAARPPASVPGVRIPPSRARERSSLADPDTDVPEEGRVEAVADLLDEGLPGLIRADATAFADSPDKVLMNAPDADVSGTVTAQSIRLFHESDHELFMFSPYFIPGPDGMAGMKLARDHDVAVRVVTNSMASTDEPLASLAYERYRIPMLKLGIELYEVSSRQVTREEQWELWFGESKSRLHAKLAIIDRKTVLLGSMNLDHRSAMTNTELGVVIRSAPFAEQLLTTFNARRRADARGVYQVRLTESGQLQWVALLGGGRTRALAGEPEADALTRFKFRVLSWFVPEGLL